MAWEIHSVGTLTTTVHWSFGIVPVQQWIAEARRSRDLLAGSAMLAWLMARVLAKIRDGGGAVAFPDIPPGLLALYATELGEVLDRRLYGIPNRASGTLPGSAERAEALFRNLEGELERGWAAAKDEIASSVERAQSVSGKLWSLVGREVSEAVCPFQLVWCLQDGAGASFEDVDRLYSAVKRSRAVVAHRGGAPVPKCGQCGHREAAGGQDPARWRDFQARLAALEDVRSGRRIEESERLCPVCLVKRFAGYLLVRPFPSTSAVASRDWLYRVRGVSDLRSLLAALESVAREVPGFDGPTDDASPLYYQRTLRRELRQARAAGDAGEPTVATLDSVGEARRKLGAEILRWNREHPKDAVPSEPSDYVAVVVFDGDDMARRVRGRPELAARTAAFQGRLERLRSASEESPADALAMAEPFYLGGDEGLLLAPAAGVLDLAAELRELWAEAMTPLEHDAPTLSMGVAIFDRERPLGAAIATARQALVRAKGVEGKDALAVKAVTASGSRWSAVERWGPGWDWSRAAIALRRSGRLAHGWAHDVERFIRSLPDQAWTSAAGAVREEVKRLTGRRTDERLAEVREETWRRLGGDEWWQRLAPADLRRALADQLHLVGFLGRQGGARSDAA